ncbi:MAG: DNA polymerase III subunit beta [Gammaproteobacteria bacterium]|nr:DNA polymerase III subunit beta [Gammaproteobacteria bacterium]
MNINIQKETLELPLSQIIGVVEKRQTLPILGNVYLELNENRLTLVGSDLETEITTLVNNISGSDGKTTVSARKLFDICRALPSESQLSLLVEEDNKMVVKAGKSRFTLQTLSAVDYPRLEETVWKQEFFLSQQQLHNLLTRTSFSMAQQDVRYFLNGLLIEIRDNEILSVATDGHRLAKTSVAVDDLGVNQFVQSIVPRKAVIEIAKFLDAGSKDKVTVKLNASHIMVHSGEFMFISKLIDGRFPDYEKVIPANLDKHIIIDRLNLIEILSRAAILSNEKFRGVSLNISNKVLKVSSHNPDQEYASDEMGIEYEGEDIEIGFNVNYLLEALKACDSEQIDLGLLDPNTSCTFHSAGDSDTLYLIMPMRL